MSRTSRPGCWSNPASGAGLRPLKPNPSYVAAKTRTWNRRFWRPVPPAKSPASLATVPSFGRRPALAGRFGGTGTSLFAQSGSDHRLVSQGMTSLPNHFYHWIRHPPPTRSRARSRTAPGFEHLRGHKYCLLVTYKRSGEPVPTPVWFGLGDGKLYVRSEATVAKVRRIRNDPRVRVAPCTVRGKPLGRPADGRARVLDHPRDEEDGRGRAAGQLQARAQGL